MQARYHRFSKENNCLRTFDVDMYHWVTTTLEQFWKSDINQKLKEHGCPNKENTAQHIIVKQNFKYKIGFPNYFPKVKKPQTNSMD